MYHVQYNLLSMFARQTLRFIVLTICTLALVRSVWALTRPRKLQLPTLAPPKAPPRKAPKHVGQHPELAQLVQLCTRFERSPLNWSALISIGDMYSRGAYPRMQPNDDAALHLYTLAAGSSDARSASLAQARYLAVSMFPVLRDDRAGKAMPLGVYHRVSDIAEYRLTVEKRTKGYIQKNTARPSAAPRVQPRALPQRPQQQQTQWPLQQQLHVPEPVPAPEPPMVEPDSQNTHDHAVGSVVRNNLLALPGTPSSSHESVLQQIERAVQGSLSADVTADAFKIAAGLGTDEHSNFGVSEQTALARVWNRIQALPETDGLKQNVTESLVQNLADCVDRGLPVCSTGKVARIVSTLDGVETDNLQTIRPTSVVTSEIAQLASKTREDVLANKDQQQKDAYNSGSGTAAREMTDVFNAALENTYVRDLGMDPKIVKKLAEPYSEAF